MKNEFTFINHSELSNTAAHYVRPTYSLENNQSFNNIFC